MKTIINFKHNKHAEIPTPKPEILTIEGAPSINMDDKTLSCIDTQCLVISDEYLLRSIDSILFIPEVIE